MSVCQEYDAVEHEIVRMHGGRREAEIVVIDDGMADAACRAILSKKATTNIRFMAKYGSFVLPFPEPLAETDVQKALERADHVVVGLQEYWEDSIRVINFFFPWIDFMHKFDYVKMPSSYRSLDTRATLPSQLLAVIEKYNACDLALYAKMKSVFAKQKKLVLDV
ncbi:hypothetical protein EON64_00670 [archaeon]|nr:MAG: hypothetical protein EON64_00670 [archaeon]